jgi:hypothetical protein
LLVINNRYGLLTSKDGCDEENNKKKVNLVSKREEGRNTIKKNAKRGNTGL